MAPTTNFSVRMDADIKKKCEALYGELGVNLTTAINLVSAGLGFTFIPEAGTKSDLLPPNIMLFTIDQPALTWPLAVFFKKGAYITPTCQNFINTLKEVYAIPSSR